jgi:hypothetical protein
MDMVWDISQTSLGERMLAKPGYIYNCDFRDIHVFLSAVPETDSARVLL